MGTTRVVLTEDDVPGANLLNPPNECPVEQLKRCLEYHGLKKSGRKGELIERVTLSNGKIKVDPKVDGGKWYNIKRDGLSVFSNDVFEPETLSPVSGWHVFPSCDIPGMFNYSHIYYYLVESVGDIFVSDGSDEDENNTSASKTVTAKPLRKSRMLNDSGFIENIQDGKSENGDYFLRAHVHHSMKRLHPLNVTVLISGASGNVRKCRCSCVASAAERCAHISALLLHLDDFVKKNGYLVCCPSTSNPCEWNKGKKRDKNPQPLH